LDEYDPKKKFSSIDHGGRYAFANQPRIALWNLTRLAEALLPLFADVEQDAVHLAKERLDRFGGHFEAAHGRVVRAKLGLLGEEEEEDPVLVGDLFGRLASNGVDYTVFFRRLCEAAAGPEKDAEIAAMFGAPGAFHEWVERWRRRLAKEGGTAEARGRAMRLANPAFIPRNHRIEAMIAAAVERADFAPFETLVRVLGKPYDDQPEFAHLAEPPRPEERVRETFCGT
jgi:uncharacterized protein YdiU (UPF0061 family)